MQTDQFRTIASSISELKGRITAAKAEAALAPCQAQFNGALEDLNRIESALSSFSRSFAEDTKNAWLLLPFGLAIGLLAALSTYDGTTYTLIGLLFAAVGGSLIGWFRETPLPALERRLLVTHVCALSCGLLLGLGIGIGLRTVAPLVTAGWARDSAAVPEQVEIRNLRKAIVAKLANEVAASDWNSAAWPATEKVLTYLETKGEAATSPLLLAGTKPLDNPVLLHAATRSEMLAISQRLKEIKAELAKLPQTPANIISAIDKQITELDALANKAEQ